MKRFLSPLLILMILWMSTWMVTDIHVLYADDGHNPHPVFSIQADDAAAGIQDLASQAGDDSDGCHFCSYDHGGHIGAMAFPGNFIPTFLPPPSEYFPPYSFASSPLTHSPSLRPPIV